MIYQGLISIIIFCIMSSSYLFGWLILHWWFLIQTVLEKKKWWFHPVSKTMKTKWDSRPMFRDVKPLRLPRLNCATRVWGYPLVIPTQSSSILSTVQYYIGCMAPFVLSIIVISIYIILSYPYFDELYHPFTVKLGMVDIALLTLDHCPLLKKTIRSLDQCIGYPLVI